MLKGMNSLVILLMILKMQDQMEPQFGLFQLLEINTMGSFLEVGPDSVTLSKCKEVVRNTQFLYFVL